MLEAVDAVVARLETSNRGTANVDIFDHPELPALEGVIPVNAIFIHSSDGYQAEGTFGRCEDLRRPFIEIIIRRQHGEYPAGAALAESLWQDLQWYDFGVNITGFLWFKSIRSAPTYVGQNKDKQHIWTMRFELGVMDVVQ